MGRVQKSKLRNSDSLSLGNKEEFTEGKASSIKLINFYFDLKKKVYIESLDLKDFLSCNILLW